MCRALILNDFGICWGGTVLEIDRIAHLDGPGLEVGGSEFPECFAGRPQVCRALIGTPGGENLTAFDSPFTVTLNQNEAFIGGN